MNVACPTCATTYRVDPAKIPTGGVKARCQVCAAVFPVSVNGARPSMAAPTQRPAIPAGMRPSASAAAVTSPPVAPPAAPAPAPVRPAAPPPAAAPKAPPIAPAPVVAPKPAPAVAPPPAAAVTAPVVIPPPAPAPPPPAPKPAAAPTPAGRPLNPFLANDPATKARRLARALVSDLVVYNTARRDTAMKNGNLKEEFAEEVKKSYEEYELQIGKELATSTTYFNDALNEILAGGQKIY